MMRQILSYVSVIALAFVPISTLAMNLHGGDKSYETGETQAAPMETIAEVGTVNTLSDIVVQIMEDSFASNFVADINAGVKMEGKEYNYDDSINEYDVVYTSGNVRISKNNNASISELTLSYCLKQENIDNVLIGVDSLTQLKDNIKSVDYKIGLKTIDDINTIKVKNLDLLNPSLWK